MTVGPDFLEDLKGVPRKPTVSGGAPSAVRGTAPSTASTTPSGRGPRQGKGTSGGRTTTTPRSTNKRNRVTVPSTPDISLDNVVEEQPARDWQQEYYDQVRREERRSAYDILRETFNSYGLSELIPEVERFFKQGLGPREAEIALRETETYKERFRGNEGRRALGLPVYSEAEYLAAENVYSELLRSNGLDSIANRKTFASLIGGAVSAAEAQDRIQNVFNRIDNADENLRQQLGQYFTQYGVGDPQKQRADVAAAILGGPETAQTLQRQLQKAELRTGAQMARYGVTEERVEQLQKQFESLGVSNVYGAAMAGFKQVAEARPIAEVLAQRYRVGAEGLGEELEQEAFFGLESKRGKRLKSQERATFAGQAGTTQVSLSQQAGGSI